MGKHLVIQFIMDIIVTMRPNFMDIIVTMRPNFMRHPFRKHPVVMDQLQLTLPFQCNPRSSLVVMWSLPQLVDCEDLFVRTRAIIATTKRSSRPSKKHNSCRRANSNGIVLWSSLFCL